MRWTGHTCLLLLLISALWPGCGCGDADVTPLVSPSRDSAVPELLLYCGAGIRPPIEELAQQFEEVHGARIVIDFAGSQMLLSKIKLSRRGDLYLPGDKHYLDQATQERLVLYDRTLGYFVPTILVGKGNPKNIRGLPDLLQEGLKLGLGNPEACAIGGISKRIFAKNHLAWEDVEKNLAFQSLTVNELGLQIQSGSLDAVIVWDAIAHYYANHGEEVPIPADQNVISTVNIGLLASTRNKPLADRFVTFATSPEGKAVFRKHHYRVQPPERP